MACLTFSNSTSMAMAGIRFSLQKKEANSRDYLKSGNDAGEITNSNLIPKKFPPKTHLKRSKLSGIASASTRYNQEKDPEGDYVEDLRVPNHWLDPLKAAEESDWLRVTLHKWLDDEYCPEETNIKISEVASQSFYKSLTEKKSDMGEILLELVRDLSTISYQESFHGAFSSANAAVSLIIQRIQLD